MQYRHEDKTIISEREVVTVRRRLQDLMQRDPHSDENGGYWIRSLYFENVHTSTFFDKIEGISDREKYRLRIYNFQGDVLLERKEKKGSYIRKESVILTEAELQAIYDNDSRTLITSEKQLIRRFEISRRLQLLKPVQLVDYYREAFTNPLGNVRITLDRMLKAPLTLGSLTDRGLPSMDALPENQSILEIKYDSFIPKHLGAVVRLDGRQRQAASKFVICCATSQKIKENYTLLTGLILFGTFFPPDLTTT